MKDQYYHTKDSAEEYIKLAKGYDGRNIIEKLRDHLPDHSSILELGIGPGVDFNILSKHYQATGSDFSKEFLNRYQLKNKQADLLELNALTLDTDRKFDGIYSNKVLHHLEDDELRKSIKNQKKILNENGIICHTFWAGKEKEYFHNLLFNNHSIEKIELFFKDSFDILILEFYKEMADKDSILIIGKKKN